MNSSVSHVKNSIEDNLEILLGRPEYVRGTILGNMDNKVADEFVEKYCNTAKESNKLKVTIGYPQDSNNLDGAITVVQGESTEEVDSIGGISSTFDEYDGETTIEYVTIDVDGHGDATFTTAGTISKINSIREIEIPNRYITIEGNKVTLHISGIFPEGFINTGDKLSISYDIARDNTSHGTENGYMVQEQVIVSSFSFNYGTMLCLRELLKAITILMRQSFKDKTIYTLPNVTFTPIQPMDSDTIPQTNPNIIFTQDMVTTVLVENSLPSHSRNRVTDVQASRYLDYREDEQ